MVKTLHFQCRRHRFHPWSGKLPHAMWPNKINILLKNVYKFMNLLKKNILVFYLTLDMGQIGHYCVGILGHQ